MKKTLAILAGKIIFTLTRILKTGGGSAAPGLYASFIDPALNKKLVSQIAQNIVITGTNGKTTTARFLNLFLEKQNIKVLRNSTGSNLQRGVLSALIKKSNWLGQITDVDLGLWELDEAAFNKVIFDIKPQIIVFLNVFRDQLDRYGEVDTIVKKWQEALKQIDWDPLVIVNGNDGHTLSLIKESRLRHLVFRIQNLELKWEKSKNGPLPGKKLFEAKILQNKGLEGSDILVSWNNSKLTLNLPIPGPYHVFDFLAAFAAYYSLNMPIHNIQAALNEFTPAFGRVEKFTIPPSQTRLWPSRCQAKLEGYIFLIKNPAGATAVFETIAPSIKPSDVVLLALNDNLADGTDVSWIWDAKFEDLLYPSLPASPKRGEREPWVHLKGTKQSRNEVSVICSGTRAHDLALRLKYAGFNQTQLTIEPDLKSALKEAQNHSQGRVFILPTYTALLKLQQILASRNIKKAYWKEEN